jgi:hypothetical protein
MFYDLLYYVILPLACVTGAAGLYYITDPVNAKTKAINASWNLTKIYVTWSDKLGIIADEYLPDCSDSEEDENGEDSPAKYFIFYNSEEKNSYITDEINDEIMKHVEDKIKPSIMFIKNKIGKEEYYKRTTSPRETDTVYNTLEEKLFIQVEFVTKDTNGKEKVIDIHSNLTSFYVNENVILDKNFLEWYLVQYYNLNEIDEYELRIFDKDVNMLTVKSNECVLIENDSYSIIESSTIKKNESSTETVEHEGAVEE